LHDVANYRSKYRLFSRVKSSRARSWNKAGWTDTGMVCGLKVRWT